MDPVITREKMFEPLLLADASFQPAWRAFCDTYAEEPELPEYLALTELAHHLITKLANGQTADFPAIFAVVEAWNVNGDRYVQEAAAVGLLEDLQNEGLHTKTKPFAFVKWLGPRSTVMWKRVEAFWDDGIPIASD